MTVTEILKLAELGYTKSEIEAMDKPQPQPQPEHDPVIEQLMKQNKEMLETIKQMQKDNAANARQQEEKKTDAQSVIKSFIENL